MHMDPSRPPPFNYLHPPNYPWANQPDPNWGYAPQNFPQPRWRMPFPSQGFRPNGFPPPPTGITPFGVPHTAYFPSLPVQPNVFAVNRGSFSPIPRIQPPTAIPENVFPVNHNSLVPTPGIPPPPPAVPERTDSLPKVPTDQENKECLLKSESLVSAPAPEIPSTDKNLSSKDDKPADTKESASFHEVPPLPKDNDQEKMPKELKSEILTDEKVQENGSEKKSDLKTVQKEFWSKKKSDLKLDHKELGSKNKSDHKPGHKESSSKKSEQKPNPKESKSEKKSDKKEPNSEKTSDQKHEHKESRSGKKNDQKPDHKESEKKINSKPDHQDSKSEKKNDHKQDYKESKPDKKSDQKESRSEKKSDRKSDHKESRSSPKGHRNRSKSSRRDLEDKNKKDHKRSRRSRSLSPPSHRSRHNRGRKSDHGTPKRYRDRNSRSPSRSRHKEDKKSTSSSHRDSEKRKRKCSPESPSTRKRHRSGSKLKVHKNKDRGHSKSRQVSEVKEKPPSKAEGGDQTCLDAAAEKMDSKEDKDFKLEQKEIAPEVVPVETESQCIKEDKTKIKEEKKEEKIPHGSSSKRSPRRVSKSERDRHSRVRTKSHKRSPRRVRRNEEEDLPALSSEPTKYVSCTTAQEFYTKTDPDSTEFVATEALKELHQKFQTDLLERAKRVRALKPKYEPPVRKTKLRKHEPPEAQCSEDDSTCSSQESSSDEEDTAFQELERKRRHPDRLHPELWFNDPREMNDGPLCRCSAKARRSGIRHGIYVGETHLPPCDPFSNNAKRLHHYKIAVTPVTNFLTKSPTVITHAGNKYIFEGFSLLSHQPISLKLPPCKVIRFNYEYTVQAVEETMPLHFTVGGLELFGRFLLKELLELEDLDWRAHEDAEGCPLFHFFPRFARVCNDESKEFLSLNFILEYLLSSNQLLVPTTTLDKVNKVSDDRWQSTADKVKGMIVTSPGMKPSAIRVDQLDREHIDSKLDPNYPVIVHFGVRPPQLSYAGNPNYQKSWREYVKYRHLLANKPKVTSHDRSTLLRKETTLQQMRMENDLKRDVTVVISSKGFYKTGMMSDIVQHAMLLPILVCHLRFHGSLGNLEEKIGYKFKDRFLLQLALTHPSYRENFGTNPDHARNSLTNCGLRQPQYGDRRIHYMNTRKRGINTLINIMSRFGSQQEQSSSIHHNERLEFLGDAVVEFLSSIHLFYLFPDLEEGGLATYRAAIVQNQHLAVLAKKLQLEKFMLYAHGSDLCHDLELRHAMANCFEALMGALFLDGGIEVADKVFSKTLFPEEELQEVWKNYPLHPLQEQEPEGDRKWIESVPLLQKLHQFEEQIGIEFTHIRLLARALTHRSLGYNNLTLGSNQRLEFLGDTVLQLVASEYLYKFFPQHHEGHLSLLRSSIVNNRTQAVVCKDLGMTHYAIYPYSKVELKPKDKADLLEAFLGALYVDKDLGYCRKFCEVCFFPRLQDFIMNQDWNDPKSKLQQCCLTLRSMDGGEPDIPTYKVIECKGPTNTRVYAVAVYFQGSRLAVGSGHSIQQAEMDAANNALMKSQDLFPQLKHQKRAIERSLKQGKPKKRRSKHKSSHRD